MRCKFSYPLQTAKLTKGSENMTRIYGSLFYFIASNTNSVTGLEWPRRFPDFMTMAQDGGKVVSLTHRSPSPQGKAPGTHFC